MNGGVRRVHVHPFPDESAPSLLIRAASLLSPLPSSVIAKLLGGESYAASSAHRVSLAQSLADFLGVPEAEVLRTMTCVDEHNYVRLGSFLLQLNQLASGIRRTCPRRFADDGAAPPYDRLVWCIRILDVDPDTGNPLICVCPDCGTKLLWSNTVHLDRCGSCHVTLSSVSPRHARDLGPALSVARLFASDPATRARQRAQLPEEIRTWPEGDIISPVECLSNLLAHNARPDACYRERAITSVFQGRDAIISILSQTVRQYRTRTSRWTDAIAYARFNVAMRHNATLMVASYLSSLMEFVR
jgi:hypothetical protein